ncbi:MAG: rhodanese-like domain-containing protein [Kordiimonadaceae bacterium]|jgi:rhodanese-related sulfurtransferase|nr:rhodanese-like domain-containing protein [Kordiimonadaceae bacterium]MBT6037413.1 rhodanese-like domain-containing protein [Kordiimonadaceae bacterium]MBT6329981.1 rhodanese-like domain-containing protein [Kordiimonadaceae bacterium]MBT7583561.1 rhodanese-like domain-containing protein [Kordiimonadaceae bacterium]
MVGQYKGDVTPEEAWKVLSEKRDAVLVDVRTLAEWKCVGVSDLSKLSKENIYIEWVSFPERNPNENFIEELKEAVPSKDASIYFLCRTGVRSVDAAIAATGAGYVNSYNILEGFEGDRDDHGHRGRISGWQGLNLPWNH